MPTYRKTCSKLSPMAQFEYEEQKTVYNGQIMSLAQAIAMRARDNRKKKEQERKPRKEFQRTAVFPGILDMIEKTVKHRNLKSFTAFMTNGPVIWSRDYRMLTDAYPRLDAHLSMYRRQHKKAIEIYEDLDRMIRRSKCHRSFIGTAEDFGYQMMGLVECLTDITNFVTRNNILSDPLFSGREIIKGSADGRRLGLGQIMQGTTESLKTTQRMLAEIQVALIHAYDDVFGHSQF